MKHVIHPHWIYWISYLKCVWLCFSRQSVLSPIPGPLCIRHHSWTPDAEFCSLWRTPTHVLRIIFYKVASNNSSLAVSPSTGICSGNNTFHFSKCITINLSCSRSSDIQRLIWRLFIPLSHLNAAGITRNLSPIPLNVQYFPRKGKSSQTQPTLLLLSTVAVLKWHNPRQLSLSLFI